MNDETEPKKQEAPSAASINSVQLTIGLHPTFGSELQYKGPGSRTSRRIYGEGIIDAPDSKFDGKSCKVDFYSREETHHLARLAQEHGLASACGNIAIAAGLQEFEDEGGPPASHPVRIFIYLDGEDYDAVKELLWSCSSNGVMTSLFVDFSHRDFSVFMRPDAVTLDATRAYPIVGFRLHQEPKDNTEVWDPVDM